MATSMASLLPLSLSFLLVFSGSLAQHRYGAQTQCRLEQLNPLEPSRRVQSEAGFTEYFDENQGQMQCAGLVANRRTIESKGLLLTSYSNAHRLVYIMQGTGTYGTLIPGCPETYQSFEQQQEPPKGQESQGRRSGDSHQKIHTFQQGDIIVVPAGFGHWCYNDGEIPVIAVTVIDTSNNANQLDNKHRKFYLAGSEQQQPLEQKQPHGESKSIFGGFDLDLLADALGVKKEVARKLQYQDPERKGEMVRVEQGLELVRAPKTERQQQLYEEEFATNGLEQAFCTMRYKENIGDPTRADVYNPRAGRLTTLNSNKLPILDFIQLGATRGVLYKNAYMAPHWSINAHSAVYATGGHARVQIVGNQGKTVFDGELRSGQLLIVPQNFAVMAQAGNEGFEWVSFKTNNGGFGTQVVGKGSLFRGLPQGVLMNSYPGLTSQEARSLKYNRGEQVAIFPPRSQSQGKADV